MDLPQPGTSQQGDAGVGAVGWLANRRRAAGGPDCLFRIQPQSDVGIDGHLEMVDESTREATGNFVGVQVKAGPSYFDRPSPVGWTVYIDHRTVNYWRSYAVPVILIIVDLDTPCAYWRRVDMDVFPTTEKSYRIEIPKSRTFDVAAADELRRIARPMPAVQRRLMPPELAVEQAEFQASWRAATSGDEYRVAATRGFALAARLREEGLLYESVWTRRDAIRALVNADALPDAAAALLDLIQFILGELRDADAANSVWSLCTIRARPDEPSFIERLATELQFTVRLASSEILAYMGSGKEAENDAKALAALAPRQATPQLSAQLLAEAFRLNSLAAIAAGDRHAAAESYAKYAETIAQSGSEEAQTSIAIVRLREHLNRGLLADAITHAQLAEKISLPDSRLEADRNMVVGWLRASTNDFLSCAVAFRNAAMSARASGDVATELRALKNAAWAERRGQVFVPGQARAAYLASQLESFALATIERHTLHERMMERVRRELEKPDLPRAFRLLEEARFLAWLDSDPAADEEISLARAIVWRAAARQAPRREFVGQALAETILTCAIEPKSEAEELAAFFQMVREHAVGAFTTDLWDTLVAAATTRERVVGALRLASHLATIWPSELDDRIGELIATGCQFGYSPSAPLDGLRAACGFVLALERPLDEGAATMVREALMKELFAAPHVVLEELLPALAVATAYGGRPKDDGIAIRSALKLVDEAPNAFHFAIATTNVLAGLYRALPAEARGAVHDELADRARQTIAKAYPQWGVVERAIDAGIDPSDIVPAGAGALADQYFHTLSGLLQQLVAQLGSGTYGGGLRDNGRMTRWAASRASIAARTNLLKTAMAFVRSPHLLFERTSWIALIAVVAAETPTQIGAAVEVMRLAASGGLAPATEFDDFVHPLSSTQVKDHTPESLTAHALQWMCTLLIRAAPSERAVIEAELDAATTSSSPAVRESVVIGAEWVVQMEATMSVSRAKRDQPTAALDALSRFLHILSKDPVDRIAASALRTLVTLAGSRSAPSGTS